MKVTVTGHNIEVTAALRSYAEKKVARLEKVLRPGGSEPAATVRLRTERGRHIVEITISSQGLLVRGEGRTPDMYASIDEAVDNIERQVQKARTRWLQRKQDRPKIAVALLAEELGVEAERGQENVRDVAAQAQRTVAGEVVDEELPRVVRVKRYEWKPMSLEEAMTQMELLGHDFFVFTNAETDEVNILYRRRDGNFGLIEPETTAK
ncbi:MAG: ribosome-associated translation inhibitor RaiA [Limnochordales bacterium]|nr:ribosome-associated translation inhibitor RaiA [Limnochordales bacterium]